MSITASGKVVKQLITSSAGVPLITTKSAAAVGGSPGVTVLNTQQILNSLGSKPQQVNIVNQGLAKSSTTNSQIITVKPTDFTTNTKTPLQIVKTYGGRKQSGLPVTIITSSASSQTTTVTRPTQPITLLSGSQAQPTKLVTTTQGQGQVVKIIQGTPSGNKTPQIISASPSSNILKIIGGKSLQAGTSGWAVQFPLHTTLL